MTRSSTVHQSPPLTRRTPAARRRSRASRGRSASHLPARRRREARRDPARLGGGAEGVEHVGADLERVAARCRRRARPDSSPGSQPRRLAQRRRRVASSTPPARPRQPACAAPTPRAAGRGEQHRQAVGDLHRAGDAGLGRDAGVGLVTGAPAAASAASRRTTRAPCTWLRKTGAAPHRLGEQRAVARRPPPASSPTASPRFIDVERRRADAAGARRHQRADARRAASPARASRRGALTSRPGRPTAASSRTPVELMQCVEDAHHRRHVVEPAVQALGVEDLRHQHAVGQRRRVAVAEAPGRADAPASWRSTASRPVSTQCRYQRFLSSSLTFSSCTR